MANFPANVGPELLGDVAKRVIADLGAPDAGRVRQSSIRVWMVTISRNARGERAPENFRVIHLRVSGVGTRHEDAADGVSRAMPETSLAVLEKTRILTK